MIEYSAIKVWTLDELPAERSKPSFLIRYECYIGTIELTKVKMVLKCFSISPLYLDDRINLAAMSLLSFNTTCICMEDSTGTNQAEIVTRM